MHIEHAHQANWSGLSPFELCTSESGGGKACGLESGLAGWAPPASVRLVEAGRALLLRAQGGVRPLACRHAWRAYPCERMGCGVYGFAEGGLVVPPASFWVGPHV